MSFSGGAAAPGSMHSTVADRDGRIYVALPLVVLAIAARQIWLEERPFSGKAFFFPDSIVLASTISIGFEILSFVLKVLGLISEIWADKL